MKTREERMHELLYDCEGIYEKSERICNLEELVQDMYKSMDVSCQFGHAIPAGTMAHVKNRAIGLGIEVQS